MMEDADTYTMDTNVQTIKVESSMDISEEFVINIKQEIEIVEDPILLTHPSKSPTQSIPMVYTTRLDDMLIFNKDFRGLSVDHIVENVIQESKPKLTKLPEDTSVFEVIFDCIPYLNLVEKIKELNKMTKLKDVVEDDISLNMLRSKSPNNDLNLLKSNSPNNVVNSDRIEDPLSSIVDDKTNLLKVCKPCSVSLAPCRRISLNKAQSFVIYDKVGERKKMDFLKGFYYKVGVDITCIVFRSWQKNSSDIYIYNNDLTCINLMNYNKVACCSEFIKNTEYGLNVDECCWFYREYVINHIILRKHTKPKKLRVPHLCPPDKCRCCCKNNNNKKMDYADDNRIGVQIRKNYNGNNMADFYEISSNKNILKYIEMDPQNLYTSNTLSLPKKLNANSDEEVCCWRKRDTLLKSFEFKDISSVTQFIRTPHPCSPNKCICCCKPSDLNPQLVDTLNSLNYERKHATKYTSLIKKRQKFMSKPKNIIMPEPDIIGHQYQEEIVNEPDDARSLTDFETLIDNTTDQSINPTITSNHRGIDKLDTLKTTLTNTTTKDKRTQRKQTVKAIAKKARGRQKRNQSTDMVLPSNQPQLAPKPSLPVLFGGPSVVLQHQLLTVTEQIGKGCDTPNNKPTTLDSVSNILLQNTTPGTDPTVDSLVNSILGRFRDVRLMITPEGNVSAELNMPLQNLSTTELLLLSKILSHARDQVKALKEAGHLTEGKNMLINPWSSMNLTAENIATDKMPLFTNIATEPVEKTNEEHTTASIQITNVSSLAPTTDKPIKNKVNTKTKFGNIRRSRCDIFQCYTNISALKIKEYMTSCRSLLNDMRFSPKIDEIYTLNEDAKKCVNTPLAPSSLNTGKVMADPKPSTSGVKRKPIRQPDTLPKKKKKENVACTIEINDSDSAEESPAQQDNLPRKELASTVRIPVVVPSVSQNPTPEDSLNVPVSSAAASTSTMITPTVENPVVSQNSSAGDPPVASVMPQLKNLLKDPPKMPLAANGRMPMMIPAMFQNPLPNNFQNMPPLIHPAAGRMPLMAPVFYQHMRPEMGQQFVPILFNNHQRMVYTPPNGDPNQVYYAIPMMPVGAQPFVVPNMENITNGTVPNSTENEDCILGV